MGYPLTLLLLHLFIIVFCHDAFLRFLRTCGIFVELSNIQGSFRHTQRSVLVGKSNLKRGVPKNRSFLYKSLCKLCKKQNIFCIFIHIVILIRKKVTLYLLFLKSFSYHNNSRVLISRYLLRTSTERASGVVSKAKMPRCLSEETMRRCS